MTRRPTAFLNRFRARIFSCFFVNFVSSIIFAVFFDKAADGLSKVPVKNEIASNQKNEDFKIPMKKIDENNQIEMFKKSNYSLVEMMKLRKIQKQQKIQQGI